MVAGRLHRQDLHLLEHQLASLQPSTFLNGIKRHPVNARGSVITFRIW